MIPIVGVSLEEALLGFGGDDDAELHNKEVTLTTSDVTGSQTAVFEYDPQDEDPQGTPPGPWDGYSLFTIDLSGVKDDIEDLQQQVSDLEDELEACHDCWEEVVTALQQYDPDYDPDEGECPADKVEEVAHKEKELEEQVEECDQCKADVIAKLQEYDPDFDPQTCEDIPPEIDKVVEEESGYEFPVGTDPETDIPPIFKANGALEDVITHTTVFEHNLYTIDGEHEYVDVGMAVQYYDSGTQQYVTDDCAHWGRWQVDGAGTQGGPGERIPPIPVLQNYTIDGTTGIITAEYLYYPFWSYGNYTTTDIYSMPSTMQELVGWGSTADTYKIKNV